MSTGFNIQPGYAYSDDMSATPKMIQEIAKTIPLERLERVARDYGLTDDMFTCGCCNVEGFIHAYANLPTEDGTCTFHDSGVHQMASGGGQSRIAKELVRRAFSSILLDECFRRGLSVSLTIS